LLKPIIEVPKVVVAFAALFEIVEITKPIVVFRRAVFRSIVCLIWCFFWEIVCSGCNVIIGSIVVVGVGVGVIIAYWRPINGGSWRPFFRQRHAGRHPRNALRTLVVTLGRLGGLDDDIGCSISQALLVGQRSRNVTMARLIRVNLLDDRPGNGAHRRAPRCKGSVTNADMRGTATALTVWHNLNLVWHSVLCPHVVGSGAGDLAMCRLVVYTLDSSDGNW
jgi:hypothetical protein